LPNNQEGTNVDEKAFAKQKSAMLGENRKTDQHQQGRYPEFGCCEAYRRTRIARMKKDRTMQKIALGMENQEGPTLTHKRKHCSSNPRWRRREVSRQKTPYPLKKGRRSYNGTGKPSSFKFKRAGLHEKEARTKTNPTGTLSSAKKATARRRN